MTTDNNAPPQPVHKIYSVSALNGAVRDLLEGNFPLIRVEGEISNLARPASGHIYFSLKDEAAQVRCAMFRAHNRLLDFRPENGQQIRVRARVSLYPARGDFQLIAEHLETAGDGALRQQFEQLKHRLSAEGLFDADHKQPLPSLPAQLGVITSPTGAAIRDILSVLKRRFPGIPVLIHPVPVQGAEAPAAIAAALRTAAARNECDLLIISRGGGSLEDLWAFNDEAVARAIHACPIPVVSAVGHEIDFTIADFVADLRAPTPSAAAERVSPDRDDWLASLHARQHRLLHAWQGYLGQRHQTLGWLQQRLKHPGQRLRERAQRLDELEQRLIRAQQGVLHRQRAQLDTLFARLQGHAPAQRLRELRLRLANLQHVGQRTIDTHLKRVRVRLGNLSHALDTVSPLATLNRGYAIVQTSKDRVVRHADEVNVGDRLTAQLGNGRLGLTVNSVHED
jgi:exodeoxyribonuclease VII large subunit